MIKHVHTALGTSTDREQEDEHLAELLVIFFLITYQLYNLYLSIVMPPGA